jgi:EmrB/QacA subfamily drug resistance transporter
MSGEHSARDSVEADLSGAAGDRQHPSLTLAILGLGTLAYALLQSAVLPALSDIQHSLHSTESHAAWLLTAYLLSASVATPILGRLGDMYGKERLLLVAFVVLAAGTLMAALVNSLPLLILARVIQGTGGGVFPLSFGIIRDEFPPEKVPGAIGLLSAIFGIGGGGGVVVGGLVVEHLSWHWLFWIPFIALSAAVYLTWRFVPESPVRVPGRINWLSGILMSIGLTAVLVAISEATSWGWGSPKTIGVLIAGLVVCAAWVLAELRASEPLIDMAMMRLRGVWTTNLAGFLLGAGMFASFILIPQFVEAPTSTGYGFGVSVLGGALFLLPATIAMLVVGVVAGRIAKRFGSKAALVMGALASTASFVLLVFAHSRQWHVYTSMGLLGVGIGLAFAAMANLIVQAVPPGQTGVATGMNTVMRSIGGAVGGQIAATVVAGHVLRSGLPAAHGYVLAFSMSLGFMAVCSLASLLVPGKRATAASGEPAGQAQVGPPALAE